jgi:hypothetical protein
MENNFYEELKEYFKNTPKKKVLEDWEKSKEFDSVGPTIGEFLGENPKMTFEGFIGTWNKVYYPETKKHLRRGQSLMNYLHEVWPQEYKRISSVHYYGKSDIDCFYKDELIDNTINHLMKVWR